MERPVILLTLVWDLEGLHIHPGIDLLTFKLKEMPSTQTKLFGKEHLKVVPELQEEIIRRYNSYDLLIRVMKLTAANLTDLALSLNDHPNEQADVKYLAARLRNAASEEWQKDNMLWY